MTVRDVAELLGNTEDMVRRRYSAWIPERQARLTKVLQEAFADKPRPILLKNPDSPSEDVNQIMEIKCSDKSCTYLRHIAAPARQRDFRPHAQDEEGTLHLGS